MPDRHLPLLLATLITVASCASTQQHAPSAATHGAENATRWVQHAAEYRALSTQAYAEAARDLPALLADTGWSALPGIPGDGSKPPAIILDVDETVVSNYDFQINHLPYTSYKHYAWSRDHVAVPVPGAVEFVRKAQQAGVEVFYVTNRPCERVPELDDACPQKSVTINDLLEAGFETDAEHVLLAWEHPHWGKEKASRRRLLAETFRIVMLFGDDLGDFVLCAREKPVAPCHEAASAASRRSAVDRYAGYWAEGWYFLPNPMHGSWTNFLE